MRINLGHTRFGWSTFRRALAEGTAQIVTPAGLGTGYTWGKQPGRRYGPPVRVPRLPHDPGSPAPMATADRVRAYGGMDHLTGRQRRRLVKQCMRQGIPVPHANLRPEA